MEYSCDVTIFLSLDNNKKFVIGFNLKKYINKIVKNFIF